MKIKFIKDYRAINADKFDGEKYTKITSSGFNKGAVINVAKFGQNLIDWLIDNGFAEEVKESGWWKPKYDEEYFYIGHDNFVHPWLWKNDQLDKGRLRLGLVFKTEEAGIGCRDYLEAIATVRQDEGVLTPEQVNELIKNEDLAYYVGRGNGETLCGCTMDFEDCWMPVGVILFDSEEHVDRSLRKHPDEWKIVVNYDWSRE